MTRAPQKVRTQRVSQGEEAQIVSHLGVAVEVRDGNGDTRMVRVPRRSGFVVGDRVELLGERIHPLPRRNALKRRSPGGGVHIVCANLDGLGIVIAPSPPPRVGLVDRAAVAARAQGVTPFIVFNKLDLDDDGELLEVFTEVFGDAILVLGVSAQSGAGIDSLAETIGALGRVAFTGHSGVGKSSLTNALIPGIELGVGALSEASGRGRHTTTVSTLHALPGGGELVDTPGVREYGLVDITVDELATYFVGFEEILSTGCRFRDCLHDSEPGCVIRTAVQAGRIDEDRYDAYIELLQELRESTAPQIR